jgi:hypothetical protein
MTTCLVVIDVLRSKAIGLALLVIARAGYHAVDCLEAHRYLGCCEHPCHHVSNTLSVILAYNSPNQAACSIQEVLST